ncbi:tRNA (cytosine(38)-C(5))-methyltransferase isoform X1 [Genypterus blacodes]|uniref:tRNA (cytosine(38)-C(5))-methyltransferase isoform X1 n=2 Tax=Genypterus blacodes TaxID=154954 RepID=UPI003F766097
MSAGRRRVDAEPLRVLELYSGIGGMHYALKESAVPAQVVAAVDINTTANEIYRHNFPDTPLWNKTIEGITLGEFDGLSFDMVLMSPPCQPFSRLGLQGDVSDPRTKSFLYILDLLPRLARLPRFILLENVKGFEVSAARDRLLQTLRDCGYTHQELMISPTSVGIPNSRLRYFLLAKLSTEPFKFQMSSEVLDGFPLPADASCPATVLHPDPCPQEEEVDGRPVLYKLETSVDVQRKLHQNRDLSVTQIQDFLEVNSEVDMKNFLLPTKTLLRYALLLDIVTPSCRRSVCFTKGYGRYVEGTGSVLQGCTDTQVQCVYEGLEQLCDEEKLQQLLKLQLRYFTPREVSNLMGFPQSFKFPQQISAKQRYKVLGNSLNVLLVAQLLQLLVH